MWTKRELSTEIRISEREFCRSPRYFTPRNSELALLRQRRAHSLNRNRRDDTGSHLHAVVNIPRKSAFRAKKLWMGALENHFRLGFDVFLRFAGFVRPITEPHLHKFAACFDRQKFFKEYRKSEAIPFVVFNFHTFITFLDR